MKKINLFLPMVALTGLLLLFVFTTTTLSETRLSSQWNLNLMAALGSVVLFYLSKEKGLFADYFSVSSLREAADKFAIGIIWGGIGVFAMNYFMKGVLVLHELALTNLFGSVPMAFLASISVEGSVFTVLVQPFTETILIGATILILFGFLRHQKIRYAMGISILVAGMIFSGFHFVSQGMIAYEQSPAGYANYIGDTRGYGQGGKHPTQYSNATCPAGTSFSDAEGVCRYTGGLPLLFLGLLWGALLIGYKNFLVPAGAHAFNNFLVLFFAPDLALPVVAFVNAIGLFFVVLIAFSVWKGGLRKIGEFNMKGFLE